MMRIMIADDHALFRQGLALLLRSTPGFEVVGEAGSGEEAVKVISETKADAALVDVSMPGSGGLDVLREVKRLGLPVKIILVTMHTDPDLAREAIKEGASGYLLKENAFEDLIAALQAVTDGGIFISPLITAATFGRIEGEDSTQMRLSSREREVLRAIARGLTNKKIARNLFISVKTVETHRARIISKLGLHSTAELVRYAVRNGMIQP
jgi:DNA-binding NarL/FixJ family response regulator